MFYYIDTDEIPGFFLLLKNHIFIAHYFGVSKMNKKSCVLCRNFVSIYKINRTLHGRLGIRILSSRAESISYSFTSLTRERYFQHSKIKFVSPRGHVISSIEQFGNSNLGTTNLPITCVKNEDQKEDKPRFTSMSY